MGLIVYYSSRSENTHRFLLKLGRRLFRLPLGVEEDVPHVSEPYVLVTPTYGDGGTKGAVPKPVIQPKSHSRRQRGGKHEFWRSFRIRRRYRLAQMRSAVSLSLRASRH